MQLSPFANTLVVLWYFVAGSVALAGLIALARVLAAIERRLGELEKTLAPVAAKADQILVEGQARAIEISNKAETILATGAHTARTIDDTTTETSHLVRRAIYLPFVELNAMISGITAGGVHLASGLFKSSKEPNR